MAKMMRAARLHEHGGLFQVDAIPMPDLRPADVLVQVAASGVVPNMRRNLAEYSSRFPFLQTPELPSVFGLDAAGLVAQIGKAARTDLKVGDRVYVNPGLSCGCCPECRRGTSVSCVNFTLRGYLGFGPDSRRMFDAYPHAGFSQFLTSAPENLVLLNESLTFEQAVRLGYLGSSYKAFLKGDFRPGCSVLIEGATGAMGVGAVLAALALGASSVFATGRNKDLLRKLRKIDPQRVVPVDLEENTASNLVNERTSGAGVSILIVASGASASASKALDAFEALGRSGRAIVIGGLTEPLCLSPLSMVCSQKSVEGSLWFESLDAQAIVSLEQEGLLNLGVFEHERFTLDQVNESLDAHEQRSGGFTNVVIMH